MDLALAHKRSSSMSFWSSRAVTAMREIQRKALNSLAAKSLRIARQLWSSDFDRKRRTKSVFVPHDEEEEEEEEEGFIFFSYPSSTIRRLFLAWFSA